jgi:hypothetical protein
MMIKLSILLISATALSACRTPTEKVVVTKEYRSFAESYYLSASQRVADEKRALQGDIVAAKRLVMYHMVVTADEKQYHHWRAVVAHLQKARAKDKQGN